MTKYRYMIGIPCLLGAGHTKEAIESVVNHPDTFVLLIDNGAEQAVKDVLGEYEDRDNVHVIHNPVNVYVNPAWNQILEFFLGGIADYLLIMNSDLILHKKWKKVLDLTYQEFPDMIPVPVISSDKGILNTPIATYSSYTHIMEGPAGVLIILNKKHAQLVYPIPASIRVWFGDNWIFDRLRNHHYKTLILDNLLTYHSGSQNVSKVPGIAEIIEEDKRAWEFIKNTI